MNKTELLQKFVDDGCALQWGGSAPAALLFPAVAEVHGKKLFFIEEFAEDQHHAHCESFDSWKKVHDLGIGFYRNDELYIYVAPLAEWPELDVGLMRASHVAWQKSLEDPTALENWNRFYEGEKELRT